MTKELPRVLGLLEATTMVVGSMIGSGIFLKASGIAQILPNPGLVLLCWLMAGLLTLSGALLIAELSTRFPGSGGLYIFLREGFGPKVAFVFGWSLLTVLQSGSIASIATGVAKNLADRYPMNIQTQHQLAYACIAGLTCLHCLSVTAGARWLQNIVTGIKYAGIMILVALGFFSGQAQISHLQATEPQPTGILLLSAMGVVMLKTLWAYDGWANATFITGEVKQPEKNLPRALIGGVLSVILAYLAINLAYHLVLSPVQLANSQSAAVAVAQACLGPGLSSAVAIMLALSMFGTLNSSILSAPRVYYAMAQNGQFPAFMGTISRFHTPYVALILQGIWAIALIALWNDFETITDNVVFVYWIFYALSVGSALKFPPPQTGYRAPLRRLLATIFISGSTLLVLSQLIQAPRASAQALIIVVPGILLSFYYGRSSKQEQQAS